MSTVTAPARLVLPHDADRDEWLAARRLGVTASEIAVILGISPFDSPFNLYWKKRGEIPEDFDNDAMSLGRHLEPWIADRWAEEHPDAHVEMGCLWQSAERPWQLATTDRDLYESAPAGRQADHRPDRVSWFRMVGASTPVFPVGILEIKSSGTYDGWGEDGTDEIPAYYRAQVLWQLDTLGLGEAHVSCLFLASRQIRNYVVPYDVADVDLMRKAAQEFLGRVQHGDPPPIDGHKATTAALKALHPTLDEDAEAEVRTVLAASYRAACDEFTRAKAQKARIENELRAAMGDAKYAVSGGEKVATRSVYEVAEHVRKASTVDKLVPPRAKKEAP